MSLGIYVDRWRLGTHSQKEIDDLMAFCDAAGIEDIFLHNVEDRAVSNNWDYIGYALNHCGQKRIHLWLSMTLGRDNSWTRDLITAATASTPDDRDSFAIVDTRDAGPALLLNPANASARGYFMAKLANLRDAYPGMYGFHIDKLTEGAGDLIAAIRQATPGKYFSIPVGYDSDFHHGWNVDEVVPMFNGYRKEQLDDVDLSAYRRALLGCFGCNLEKTAERIARLKTLGVDPVFYSYGSFSFNPQETYAQFIEAINNAQ